MDQIELIRHAVRTLDALAVPYRWRVGLVFEAATAECRRNCQPPIEDSGITPKNEG